MATKLVFYVFVFAFFFLTAFSTASPAVNILHAWKSVDYVWANSSQRQDYIDKGLFVPINNIVTGVKSYKGVLYATVPRWRTGVPSTLNTVVVQGGVSLLKPFPSWSMQDYSSYSNLWYVQSMEIDFEGIMWIIDVGRLNIFDVPENLVNGAPKLLLYDLNANKLLSTFVFPDSVASYTGSFMNDIVLDTARGFAYISDTGTGAVIVYDRFHNMARRFSSISTKNNPSVSFNINGVNYGNSTFLAPTDGISISVDTETVYYCALQGQNLYSVPAAMLRDFSSTDDQITAKVTNLGMKPPSDGLAMTADGKLFFGDLNGDGVKMWDVASGKPFSSQTAFVNDNVTMQWVDTFAFDGNGNILFTTNRLQLYFTHTLNTTTDSNFRIISVPIAEYSYISKQSNYINSDQENSSCDRKIFTYAGAFFVIGAFFGWFFTWITITTGFLDCGVRVHKRSWYHISNMLFGREQLSFTNPEFEKNPNFEVEPEDNSYQDPSYQPVPVGGRPGDYQPVPQQTYDRPPEGYMTVRAEKGGNASYLAVGPSRGNQGYLTVRPAEKKQDPSYLSVEPSDSHI